MSAIRYQVTATVLGLMQALGAAEVELEPSSDPVSFDAIHIFDHGHRTVDGESGNETYQLNLTIERYYEADGSDTYVDANEGYAEIAAAMKADPPLGGLAEWVAEGDLRMFTAPLAGASRRCVAVDFTIQFATSRTDPAQAA